MTLSPLRELLEEVGATPAVFAVTCPTQRIARASFRLAVVVLEDLEEDLEATVAHVDKGRLLIKLRNGSELHFLGRYAFDGWSRGRKGARVLLFDSELAQS